MAEWFILKDVANERESRDDLRCPHKTTNKAPATRTRDGITDIKLNRYAGSASSFFPANLMNNSRLFDP